MAAKSLIKVLLFIVRIQAVLDLTSGDVRLRRPYVLVFPKNTVI
jgi:hypothetical protein